MDRNSIPGLIEETDTSISETLELIDWMNKTKKDNDIVKYIITPRYVPCTTSKLMEKLGKLSSKYELPVQSHLDENKDEINWVSKLHPECLDFISVYNRRTFFKYEGTYSRNNKNFKTLLDNVS